MPQSEPPPVGDHAKPPTMAALVGLAVGLVALFAYLREPRGTFSSESDGAPAGTVRRSSSRDTMGRVSAWRSPTMTGWHGRAGLITEVGSHDQSLPGNWC